MGHLDILGGHEIDDSDFIRTITNIHININEKWLKTILNDDDDGCSGSDSATVAHYRRGR